MNMSYCRFRNTLNDFNDCFHSVRKRVTGDEKRALIQLVQRSAELLCELNLEDYISTYNLPTPKEIENALEEIWKDEEEYQKEFAEKEKEYEWENLAKYNEDKDDR